MRRSAAICAKTPDVPAQRGLVEVELLRGAGEVELLRDGDEVPQITQIEVHANPA